MEVKYTMNKLVGIVLLLSALATVICMYLNNDVVWSYYNYVTIVIFLAAGIINIRQK